MSTTDLLPETIKPKRRAIMAAAAELFMAEGYAAASMDRMARPAGVSKATLYAHFTGKDALFKAIIADGCETMRREADGVLARSGLPLRDALVEVGLPWLRFMLRPQVRALHRVTIAEAIRFPELARAFYAAGPRAMHIWLTSWMADEQAHGRLRPGVLPARAAEQFTSLLRSDLFVQATPGLVEEEMARLN